MAEFDKSRGRYIVDGRVLSLDEIRSEIRRIERYYIRQTSLISQQLWAGKVSLAEWQIQIRDLVRASHVLSTTIGFGGFQQMTPAKWGKVGVRLREEYKALNNFARQVEQGKVIFESQLIQRAQSYARQFRVGYFTGEKAIQRAAGFTLCERVIHSLEQCIGCRRWASKGLVPIEEQPEIGTLNCGQFCRCTFVYV